MNAPRYTTLEILGFRVCFDGMKKIRCLIDIKCDILRITLDLLPLTKINDVPNYSFLAVCKACEKSYKKSGSGMLSHNFLAILVSLIKTFEVCTTCFTKPSFSDPVKLKFSFLTLLEINMFTAI